jgi:hypothetical protein
VAKDRICPFEQHEDLVYLGQHDDRLAERVLAFLNCRLGEGEGDTNNPSAPARPYTRTRCREISFAKAPGMLRPSILKRSSRTPSRGQATLLKIGHRAEAG